MSRFYDIVSKPARLMGTTQPSATPPARPHSSLIRLDANENPFGPSPAAVDAIRSAIRTVNSYPDDDCSPLRQKLARHHDLKPEQVLVTAGSTGMLSLLCQTLLAPGLNAVTSERSFIIYSMAVHATGAQLIEARTRNDSFDLDAMLAAIDGKTRIVFLANPNNPTGTMLEAAEIERFRAQLPSEVVLVLDEAYYEFALRFAAARRVTYPKSLDYVRQGASVVVLRTFSKVHGLAGLRIGYGMGPAELLDYCGRMRNTFSVSSIAQAAAMAAIDDADHIQRVVENNFTQARTLSRGLSALGHRVVPTAANFIFCETGADGAVLAAFLRDEGIAVKPLGPWGAPNAFRVTVGTPDQNRSFLQAMGRLKTQLEHQDHSLKPAVH